MSKLIFKKPAKNWEECKPIGNGYLGAMVLGNPNHEILYLNEDSLYSGEFIDRSNSKSGKYISEVREALMSENIKKAHEMSKKHLFPKSPHPRHYEPLGQVHIENFNSTDYSNYLCQLNLNSGYMEYSYSRNHFDEKRTIFSSYPRNEMFYSIKGDNLNLEIYFTRRSPISGQSESFLDETNVINNSLIISGYNGNQQSGLKFSAALSIHSCDGDIEYCDSKIIISNAGTVVLGIVGRTSFRSPDSKEWCLEVLKKNKEIKFDEIFKEHINDYSELFNRSSINFSNTENYVILPDSLTKAKEGKLTSSLIQAYFNFGKYLLISSSRKGSLPANLQGIWSKDFTPPWGSRYTININTEMNYWFCEKIGLSELHFPLFEFQKQLLNRGKIVAKKMYNAKGTVTHHNTDIFGDSAPSDFYMPATIWPMGAIWLSLHILEHFNYSKDLDFLSEYYYIIKSNWDFIQTYLFEFNGYLNTGPSVSPENSYILKNGEKGQLCISPTMDIQIIREFLNQFLELPLKFVTKDMRIHVHSILKKLPPTRIDSAGCIMEWQKEYIQSEPGHRHISHLFGLFPGSEINEYSELELIEACKKTLERRLENGGGHTGWSCAWIINFWARLNNSTQSYKYLEKLLTQSTMDNLLDNHPPFQIDGNFGGVNGILEMLIHDYGTIVHLLPALPKELNSGRFEGLVLKSGLIIDFEWKNGILVELDVRPLRDTNVIFDINGLKTEYSFLKDKKMEII